MKGLFSHGSLLENVLENIIFGQVAVCVGDLFRTVIYRYVGWSFIKICSKT